MPDDTKTPSGSSATGPVTTEGDALYDEIMDTIEPELTTDQLPLLAEKYKEETSDEATARAERYARAFSQFEKKFREKESTWIGDIRALQRSARTASEHKTQLLDDDDMGSITNAISQS
jgi:hypothetical protein